MAGRRGTNLGPTPFSPVVDFNWNEQVSVEWQSIHPGSSGTVQFL